MRFKKMRMKKLIDMIKAERRDGLKKVMKKKREEGTSLLFLVIQDN